MKKIERLIGTMNENFEFEHEFMFNGGGGKGGGGDTYTPPPIIPTPAVEEAGVEIDDGTDREVNPLKVGKKKLKLPEAPTETSNVGIKV